MTNLPNDRENNLVNFLRQNRPAPPQANLDLERRLIDSLESDRITNPYLQKVKVSSTKRLRTPVKVIATGFLFTSVSFGIKTPRIALEPKDLENFLVGNWHNTLKQNTYGSTEAESYWLLPTAAESTPALTAAP